MYYKVNGDGQVHIKYSIHYFFHFKKDHLFVPVAPCAMEM